MNHLGGRDNGGMAPVGDQTRYYAGVRDAILGVANDDASTTARVVAVMAALEAATVSASEHGPVPLGLDAAERAAFTRPTLALDE